MLVCLSGLFCQILTATWLPCSKNGLSNCKLRFFPHGNPPFSYEYDRQIGSSCGKLSATQKEWKKSTPEFLHYWPCPTVCDCPAVYPALFLKERLLIGPEIRHERLGRFIALPPIEAHKGHTKDIQRTNDNEREQFFSHIWYS